jgi:hypothetical protein
MTSGICNYVKYVTKQKLETQFPYIRLEKVKHLSKKNPKSTNLFICLAGIETQLTTDSEAFYS